MKIIKLAAENFKRLRAVEITPAGDLVEVRGRNGAGKSSVLDAIWTALGGARVAPERPVREGEESATIRLDLGELVVTRRFRSDGETSLVVTAADGARYPSPQRVLDELLGAVALDPLEFLRWEPKRQVEMLRRVVKLDVDLDELDRLSAADRAARTEANREADRNRALVTSIAVPDDTPDEPIDVDALLAEMQAITAHNRDVARQAAELARVKAALVAHRVKAAEMLADAEEFRRRAEASQAKSDEMTAAADARERALTEAPEPRDDAPVVAAVRAAQGTNNAVKRKAEREQAREAAEIAASRSRQLTAAIEERDNAKRGALSRAELPVPDLGFDAERVTLNGLPLAQASSSDAMRVSVALAMAANPRLRVLCVRHGNDLDTASLAQLAALVRERDYQLWLEVVDDDARTGIVIEDGAVAITTPLLVS